jgi:AraC-like DNA-binding protein
MTNISSSKIQYTFLLLLLLHSSLPASSQTVKVERIPFKTYDYRVSLESDVVNKTSIPKNFRSASGIVTNASKNSTPDTNKIIKKIKDEWIKKNNPADEGSMAVKYGLVRTGEGYFIRKFNSVVTYGVVEIGGGSRIQRYLRIIEKNYSELLCLFNDSVIAQEYRVTLFPVKADEWMVSNDNMYGFDENQFMNNIRLSFNNENNNYSIDYTSDLCKMGVSSGRSGTILTVHINVKLKLIDNTHQKQQILIQIPDGRDINLTGIYYGDIDNANKCEIILTILSDSQKCNLVYLSSKSTADNLLEYLGYYEADRIDP